MREEEEENTVWKIHFATFKGKFYNFFIKKVLFIKDLAVFDKNSIKLQLFCGKLPEAIKNMKSNRLEINFIIL